jgi:hypothetical protein
VWTRRIVYARSRISLNEACFHCPTEKASHRIKKMTRLVWGVSATVTACHDGCRGDLGEWLLTGRLEDVFKDIFALPTSRR